MQLSGKGSLVASVLAAIGDPAAGIADERLLLHDVALLGLERTGDVDELGKDVLVDVAARFRRDRTRATLSRVRE